MNICRFKEEKTLMLIRIVKLIHSLSCWRWRQLKTVCWLWQSSKLIVCIFLFLLFMSPIFIFCHRCRFRCLLLLLHLPFIIIYYNLFECVEVYICMCIGFGKLLVFGHEYEGYARWMDKRINKRMNDRSDKMRIIDEIYTLSNGFFVLFIFIVWSSVTRATTTKYTIEKTQITNNLKRS